LRSAFYLHTIQQSDVGQAREVNEDAYGRFEPADEDLGERGCLYVVADGLGGHAAGDVASQLAVETILDAYFNSQHWEGPARALREAIERANEEIYNVALRDPSLREMGTTIVAAAVQGERATLANVGDSRGYLLRDGQLEQVTRDHSWVAKAVEEGVLTPEQARHHPDRHVIYRSLGSETQVEVDVFARTLRLGDRILLCSDGLTDVLTDETIVALADEADLAAAVQALIDAANDGGGPDNITATLVAVESSPMEPGDEHPTPHRLEAVPASTDQRREAKRPGERLTVPRGASVGEGEEPGPADEEKSFTSENRRRGWLRRLLRGE